MSGIYATSVRRDDSGIRHDNALLLQRSRERGRDDQANYVWFSERPDGEPTKRQYHAGKTLPLITTTPYWPLQFLGCAYSAPASLAQPPEFLITNDDWTLAIDGIVAGITGEELLARVSQFGWESFSTLPGQYAVLGYRTEKPRTIYWATRAKPLYALWQQEVIRVASLPECFDGMYHPVRSSQPFALGPYEYGWLTNEGLAMRFEMTRPQRTGSLILSGGGVDTLVAAVANQRQHSPEDVVWLYVDYGAKAAWQEWVATQLFAAELARLFPEVSVSAPQRISFGLATDSALDSDRVAVNKQPIPGKATEWVPGRNTVLMAIGASFAEAAGLARIVTGINLEAAIAYPDNELEWYRRWAAMLPFSTDTECALTLEAPVGAMTKTEIIKAGKRFGIDWLKANSWSCYEGGTFHCGLCSSCSARRKAFRNAHVKDPTIYAA